MTLSKSAAYRKDITSSIGDMQHRHFATIAAIIREMPADVYGPEQVAKIFASRLADTNPRFNSNRFLRACNSRIES